MNLSHNGRTHISIRRDLQRGRPLAKPIHYEDVMLSRSETPKLRTTTAYKGARRDHLEMTRLSAGVFATEELSWTCQPGRRDVTPPDGTLILTDSVQVDERVLLV